MIPGERPGPIPRNPKMVTGDPNLFSKCPRCGYPEAEMLLADRGTPHLCPGCGGEGHQRICNPASTSLWETRTCPICKGERVLWSRG